MQVDLGMILCCSARRGLRRRRRGRDFLGILGSICRRSLVLHRRRWRRRTMEYGMIVSCVSLGREASGEDEQRTRGSTDHTEFRHKLVTDLLPLLILG